MSSGESSGDTILISLWALLVSVRVRVSSAASRAPDKGVTDKGTDKGDKGVRGQGSGQVRGQEPFFCCVCSSSLSLIVNAADAAGVLSRPRVSRRPGMPRAAPLHASDSTASPAWRQGSCVVASLRSANHGALPQTWPPFGLAMPPPGSSWQHVCARKRYPPLPVKSWENENFGRRPGRDLWPQGSLWQHVCARKP